MTENEHNSNDSMVSVQDIDKEDVQDIINHSKLADISEDNIDLVHNEMKNRLKEQVYESRDLDKKAFQIIKTITIVFGLIFSALGIMTETNSINYISSNTNFLTLVGVLCLLYSLYKSIIAWSKTEIKNRPKSDMAKDLLRNKKPRQSKIQLINKRSEWIKTNKINIDKDVRMIFISQQFILYSIVLMFGSIIVETTETEILTGAFVCLLFILLIREATEEGAS